MAMVAAAVANHGTLMTPHLTDRVVDTDGRTVEQIKPTVFSQVMSPQTATEVGEMMSHVVNDGGTGTAAALPGIEVAGKTGTAQLGSGTSLNQVSFIAFAPLVEPADRDRRDGRARDRSGRHGGRADRQGGPAIAARCRVGSAANARAGRRYADRPPLPRDLADRVGRDGGRLLLRGPPARPAGRRQAAPPALRRGRGVRRAIPPRGVERGVAVAPERRRGVRPRRVGRDVLHRDGVSRRPVAEGADPRGGRRCRRSRAIEITLQVLGATRFAHQRGRHPPRHQAAQRDRRLRRAGSR